ncbi:hypothetical protein HMPREF1153_0199 [Selenomonas sp. CM52]|nr:hypothetical protein HMPREF1153_0199 [Selenomonas sp. CM52]
MTSGVIAFCDNSHLFYALYKTEVDAYNRVQFIFKKSPQR